MGLSTDTLRGFHIILTRTISVEKRELNAKVTLVIHKGKEGVAENAFRLEKCASERQYSYCV